MYKISIIVPIYNVASFLPLCLNSIIKQKYHNLEIILVDDGSTDNSLKICQAYQRRDPRIKVISQNNQGTSAAKNHGLEIASGNLITFVDADDWYSDPDSLLILHNLYKQKNADIAVGNFNKYDDQQQKYFIHIFTSKSTNVVMSPHQWFKYEYSDEEAISQCFSTPWGKLFKRKYFKHIRFPEGLIDEDDLTMWKIFLQAKRIAYTNHAAYVYRDHRVSSITSNANSAQLFSIPAINQRITLEKQIGFDNIIPKEINAYLWRLQMHRNNALKVAELSNFKQAQQSINIINKYSKGNY